MMMETEMGYRGSKSEFHNPQPIEISVKEQRVDGSYFGFYPRLRCTLTGGESRYHIKILSKQIKTWLPSPYGKPRVRTFSSRSNILNPWFITGFTDAEGCFSIGIRPDAKLKTKWRVSPVFIIKLHKKDLIILEDIKKTLNLGKIRKSGENCVQYVVESFKELQEIVNHFDNYPLVTAKVSDFLLFKQCFSMIKNGEHLTVEGLLKIVSLKTSLNWGISTAMRENLTKNFPSTLAFGLLRAKAKVKQASPVNSLEYKFKGIPDPYWIAGFTSGDGSFQIRLRKLNTNIGHRVSLLYSFHLHIRDLDVLKGLANYFNNRENLISNDKKVSISSDKSVHLQIAKFTDIKDKIIPFFDKYPIEGVKSLDFEDFKKVCKLIENKEHLTPLGIKAILDIKSNMNQNRKF
uniref:LAGLIDADG homing endonuclease n=1 Tax=Blastosporella zonata TaxID=530045 RepID=A0A386TY77_9AGAR|nr:LAGLIDADG homing endonuclease [Blastosporella zonata]YP_009517206.1 LAGLIDADG homing endonuclease [Blastosporella zonata]AYE93090.1 LAGLIDADG homing endonuclease [Blastosporella zonata]AYE93091.1 LAGLIDADG homing endonuclease [Blastosporella zonata]